nr:hypothetical protein [Bacteroidota bacterium]
TDDSYNSNTGTGYSGLSTTSITWVSSTAPIPFTTVTASNWNSTSTWNSASVPNCSWAIVTIDDNTSIDVDVDAFMVTINSGKTLTINSGKSLTLCGPITNNGTVTVKEEASFLDGGTMTGSGSYTLERPIDHSGWHYVSPPISSPTANSFWGSALYRYDETTANWTAQNAGDNLTVCRGYDTWYKPAAAGTVNFTGTFNTGSQSISVTYTTASAPKTGWNLVGNPYPSYLDWDAAGWTKTNVNNAIYIWDEDQSNFTSYVTGSGGTNGGSRYIPPAQGFLVSASTTGASVAMTNACRVHNTVSFRAGAIGDLLRLKLSGLGYSDEAVIRFDPHASNDFDGSFDAFKVRSSNISTPQISTRSADMKELSINTFAGLYQNISVPLLARVGVSGEYELSINIFEFDQNTHLYLEDLQDGKIYDINQNSKLTFNFGVNDAAERFIIHFTPLPTLESPVANGLDDAEEPISNVYSHDKDVYIDIFENNHGYVHIYNMNADEIYNGELRRSMNKITLAEKANGYYFIKLILDKEVTTHKVLIR